MPKLIFRAALIRYVDLRYDEKAKAKYVKINFTASFGDQRYPAGGRCHDGRNASEAQAPRWIGHG
jgi:hypothetical protein